MPLSGFRPSKTPSASAAIANVVMDVVEDGGQYMSLSFHDLSNPVIDRLVRRLQTAGWHITESEGLSISGDDSYKCVRAAHDNVLISMFRPQA